jgi:endonuclease/exonuclease/phosphatase family metal-dependent hydrolase
MYRRTRFAVLAQGFFFFSPEPDEIYSRSWDGGFPAFCSWVRFRDLHRNTAFYLYNVHLDHSNRANRIKSAELIASRIGNREHSTDPVIVAGDFNAPWFFKPLRILEEAGLDIADTTGSTFHFFRGINVLPAIDHVLVSPPFAPVGTRVLRHSYRDTWPSDHYPVFVTISQ